MKKRRRLPGPDDDSDDSENDSPTRPIKRKRPNFEKAKKPECISIKRFWKRDNSKNGKASNDKSSATSANSIEKRQNHRTPKKKQPKKKSGMPKRSSTNLKVTTPKARLLKKKTRFKKASVRRRLDVVEEEPKPEIKTPNASSMRQGPTYPNTQMFLVCAKPYSGKSTFFRKAFQLKHLRTKNELRMFPNKNGRLSNSEFIFHAIGKDTYVIGDYAYRPDEANGNRFIGADRLSRAHTSNQHMMSFVTEQARNGIRFILLETNHLPKKKIKHFRNEVTFHLCHVKLDRMLWDHRCRNLHKFDYYKVKDDKETFWNATVTSIENRKLQLKPDYVKVFSNFVKLAQFLQVQGVPLKLVPMNTSDFAPGNEIT